MKKIKFKAIYWQQNWIENGVIHYDEQGVIRACDAGLDFKNESNGYLIPGFQNCHSHAFQYAMAGLSEYSTQEGVNDNFWTWRNSMYGLVAKLDSQQIENIAAALYAQMLANGYTSVAEFHYIHKQVNGDPYPVLEELSLALERAAQKAGIKLTLIPIFYNKGGFGKTIQGSQRRFYLSLDEYTDLISRLKESLSPATILGSGVHSLRAAELKDCNYILSDDFNVPGPKHIHISEQLSEVDEFSKLHGKRPVEWLCESIKDVPVNLVHATHLSSKEVELLLQSSHNVVLCPSTEANLGDGIFPCVEYFKKEGLWCIGSDSHIKLSPFQELEILDYTQRLIRKQRNPFASARYPNSGKLLFDFSRAGSEIATGRHSNLDIGHSLDGIVIKADHPSLVSKSIDQILSAMIYTFDPRMIESVLVDGKVEFLNQDNSKYKNIYSSYQKTMNEIFA